MTFAPALPIKTPMKIIRHTRDITPDLSGAVAALGNFDGVHLGHQAVIARAKAIADAKGASSAVMTFEPHPRMLFQPDGAEFRLTSADARAEAIAALGVDILFEVPFDEALSYVSAEDFVSMLRQAYKLTHVVIGYDFHFGHRRRGTPDMMIELAREMGFEATCLEAEVEEDGAIYSSSRVRQCLNEGDPKGAAALLGRPWEIVAEVVKGDQRGRTIGFPTANLQLADLMHPAHGVYAIEASIEGDDATWIKGVANFGRRPTVNDRGELLEVHLFDVEPDLYGKRLKVRLLDFIRPEMKFDGLDALKAQIARDEEKAREILSNS